MSEIAEEVKDTVKEPQEPDHEAKCHLLNNPEEITAQNGVEEETTETDGDGSGDATKNEDAGGTEKGQLDEEPEVSKEELPDDGWIYVLGHELLKKRTIKQGEGIASRPVNSQVVTFRYKGCIHEEEKEVDSSEKALITLGDGDSLMAFDLCLALMEKGEVCEVVTDAKYAYGAKGRAPDIPSNASLQYELELLEVSDPPDPAKMSPNERISKADLKRERGNSLYAQGDYTSAISSYTKALKILGIGYDVNIKDEEDKQMLKDARVKCYNNLAAAQLKVDAWDAAIKSSDEVLRIEPNNVKALFRKGKCQAGKGDVPAAIKTLRQALNLEPETKIIHQELSRLVTKQRGEEEKQREMYRRMLGTDNTDEGQIVQKRSSRWWWTAAGVAAAAISVGLGVLTHRQLHT